jgi:hypothetical protein
VTDRVIARLTFLARVVGKEIDHLLTSQQMIFEPYFSLEQAHSLASDSELAIKVEAFSSRFARLQDTVGDKLLPTWLAALNEPIGAAIDNLNKAEKLGVLASVEEWLAVRSLRNQMVHEYIESIDVLTNALNQANEHVALIVDCAASIIDDCRLRGWL